MTENRAFRKTRIGQVVSDKMDKTIVVAIEDSVQHPLYKKTSQNTEKKSLKMFSLLDLIISASAAL